MHRSFAATGKSTRTPLLPLVLVAGAALVNAHQSRAVELVSVTPAGKAGDTDVGIPDSGAAAVGVPFVDNFEAVAFQSKASDFLSGGVDANGMSDVYLWQEAQPVVL